MTNGSLMKAESIRECSPLGAFCNTFDLHEAIIGLETIFVCLFLSDRFTQVITYVLRYNSMDMLSFFQGYGAIGKTDRVDRKEKYPHLMQAHVQVLHCNLG